MKMGVFLFTVLLFSAASIECWTPPRVTLDQGTVEGCTGLSWNGHTFYSFFRLPYAKPPTGELRFKAPEKPYSWSGVYDATLEGPACRSSFPQPNANMTYSEDCLYANVFTKHVPTINGNSFLRPVLVFLHGGAFVRDSPALNLFGPEYFMSEDVVLVTINYRLGVFGFLSIDDVHLGVPGNAGLKDQRMALQWIQKNIARFGGNPHRVTIFGEGAGAASVQYHILSPGSKGLFHRAVMQSGNALASWARGRKNAILVAKTLGKHVKTEAEALQVLMEATADQLVDAGRKIYDDLYGFNYVRPFGPVIEYPNYSEFLTEEPRDILASGKFNKVPMIIGLSDKEAYLAHNDTESLNRDLRDYIPWTLGIRPDTPKVHEIVSGIKEIYLQDGTHGIYDLLTDLLFLNGAAESARIHSQYPESPVYFYELTVGTNLAWNFFKVPHEGVTHRQILAYQFKQRAVPAATKHSKEGNVIEKFMTFWANFAETGNPTSKNVGGIWKRVSSPDRLNYLEIGDELIMKVNPHQKRVNFWRGFQGQNSTIACIS